MKRTNEKSYRHLWQNLVAAAMSEENLTLR